MYLLQRPHGVRSKLRLHRSQPRYSPYQISAAKSPLEPAPLQPTRRYETKEANAALNNDTAPRSEHRTRDSPNKLSPYKLSACLHVVSHAVVRNAKALPIET